MEEIPTRKEKPITVVEKPTREVYVLNAPNISEYTSVNVFIVLFCVVCFIASVVFSIAVYIKIDTVKLYKQDVIISQGQEISNLQRDYIDVRLAVEVIEIRRRKLREEFFKTVKTQLTPADRQLILDSIDTQLSELKNKKSRKK